MKQLSILLLIAMFCVASFGINDANAADKKKDDHAGPSVHFIELNPIMLPMIDGRGITKTVSLVIAVEVDSQEKADQVTKYSPRLADAYLSDLYGTFSNHVPENGIIPIVFVKERLNMVSAKVLGQDVVSDVLVQVLQSRAI